MGDLDLDFLEPWRRVLERFVRFDDEEELVAGTLHDKLQCVCINIFFVGYLYAEDDHQSYPAWRRELVVKLREAMELVGFLLHYNKRAWPWLRPEKSHQIALYEPEALEPHFQFIFHDTFLYVSGDDEEAFEVGLDVLTAVGPADLTHEYRAAKQQLLQLIGDKYDPLYQVQVSMVLAPDKGTKNVSTWCASVGAFARVIAAQSHAAASCFDFRGFHLYIWQLRVDANVAALLDELLQARAHVLEVSLRLADVRGLHSGKATNTICKPGLLEGYRTAARLVDELSLHECSRLAFVQSCTSLVEATSLERLFLYEAFGDNPVERATKWWWLGYVLSREHVCSTSIRHLRIENTNLTACDMRHFIGDTADSPYPMSPRPPRRDGDKRCVRVEAGSSICVSGASWRRLEALGMTEADHVLVVDDFPTGETTDILVPGFGICQTKNESITDVLPMSPSTSGFNLASLQCGIDRCEPETLRFLSRAIPPIKNFSPLSSA